MEPLELRVKMGIRVSEEAQALAIQAGVAIQALGRLAPLAMMLSQS